jgi:hypothetical protein
MEFFMISHTRQNMASFALTTALTVTLSLGLASAVTTKALALVPPEQIERLQKDLTPLGSERGGNADGSIPAWTGGVTSPPQGIGYEKGKHLPDPFAQTHLCFASMGPMRRNMTPLSRAAKRR